MLISHKKTFIFLTLTYALIMIIVGGVTSQETYTKINDLLKQSSKDTQHEHARLANRLLKE